MKVTVGPLIFYNWGGQLLFVSYPLIRTKNIQILTHKKLKITPMEFEVGVALFGSPSAN